MLTHWNLDKNLEKNKSIKLCLEVFLTLCSCCYKTANVVLIQDSIQTKFEFLNICPVLYQGMSLPEDLVSAFNAFRNKYRGNHHTAVV